MNLEEKNKKRLIIGGVVVFAILLIVGIVLMINYETPHFPDVDDGPGEEVDEKSLVFYNRDILSLAYSEDFSTVVLDNITTVVFSEEEMKFSKDNSSSQGDDAVYYDATIDVGTFTSYDVYTSRFEVNISDERKYMVIARTDNLESDFTYVYTAILRDGGSKIAIFINGSESDKSSFVKFTKEKLGKNIVDVVTVKLGEELPAEE